MSDIQEEQKRLYKRAEENDYYFKKNNELSSLNTSLRSQRDELQNRINKAIEYIEERAKKAGVKLMPREEELLNILKGDNK